MKKQQLFKIKGMNKDTSVSSFSPEFSFENRNLRLSTNDDNTTLSWVNEKGQKSMTIVDDKGNSFILQGSPIGTAVIDHELILFTTDIPVKERAAHWDYIYSIKVIDNDKLLGYELFKGILKFDIKHPLETHVSYEAENIKKVYWTDGINQPRVINIVKQREQNEAKQADASDEESGDNVKHIISSDVYTYFDFTPAIVPTAFQSITVKKNQIGGVFPQGVIQYCYSFYKKNGQQSNIVDVSPIEYLSFQDRGASPKENVSCSFEITISHPDTNFDYVRIYSIQRTSYDAMPLAYQVVDLPINNSDSITYTDTGLHSITVDPYELLFIGGKDITALTMTDKDNKLFLGNISQKNSSVSTLQKYFDDLRKDNKIKIDFAYYTDDDTKANKYIQLEHNNGVYVNTNQLAKYNQREIAGFKGGEWYRFGFQLQKTTGEWLEPIFLDDAQNTKYPLTFDNNNADRISFAIPNVTLNLTELIKESGYSEEEFNKNIVRIRPVVVYPSFGERTVLCQGVLNPTVFNAADRATNSPYSQASWFFRPYVYKEDSTESEKTKDNSGFDIKNKVDVKTTDDVSFLINDASKYISDGDKTAYILLATIKQSDLAKIIENGYIEATYQSEETYTVVDQDGRESTQTETVDESYHINYDKAIQLHVYRAFGNLNEPAENSYLYAFIKNEPWPIKVDKDKLPDAISDDLTYPSGYIIIDYSANLGIPSDIFKISSKLKTGTTGTNNKLLYYEKESESSPSSYVFQFFKVEKQTQSLLTATIYTVTFNDVGIGIYETEAKDLGGSNVEYMHYQHLYSQQDYQKSAEKTKKNAQRIEIQGSSSIINDPYSIDGSTDFDKDNYSQAKASSEFFVDQSIVTLNSPDIECDTRLQNIATDGLGLRIVGYIPITSNASAHHITTSSNMAYLGLNNGATTAYYGVGEIDDNIIYGYPINSYAGRRLIAGFLWNDTSVWKQQNGNDVASDNTTYDWLVFPWQAKRSLNYDPRSATGETEPYSMLSTKKESTLLYSINSVYFDNYHYFVAPVPDYKYQLPIDFESTSVQITSTDNTGVYNVRLSRQSTDTPDINYYPNIDKVLVNKDGYGLIRQNEGKVEYGSNSQSELKDPIAMKYNSTGHAVIALKEDEKHRISILPYASYENSDNTFTDRGLFKNIALDNKDNYLTTYWGSKIQFTQKSYPVKPILNNTFFDVLWLGELVRTNVNEDSLFGGKTESAVKNNNWVIAGAPKELKADSIDDDKEYINLKYTMGDTYYQRYDCLKTYPVSKEDVNQLTEILSFMCESRVNIDGRYDRNRGHLDNTMMTPENFNLFNDVYNQPDNFFEYKKTYDTEVKYPNLIAYTLTKTPGADIDEYTHVTLASSLALDGDKGSINSLNKLNNNIIAFQDTGIAQILYNENAQIATTNGAPIELANNNTVQGARYISSNIGCSNKHSIVDTAHGIYFIDSNNKDIYLLGDRLKNLSVDLGFNTWSKKNIPGSGADSWNPYDFNNFVSYYDALNQDILFINKDIALAYSEKYGVFTSFYDYGRIPYMVNLDSNTFFFDSFNGKTRVLKHNEGNYNKYYVSDNEESVFKPYWMTLVSNQEPQSDKIFTNIEFRATTPNNDSVNDEVPFDSIEVWNDYQHGITSNISLDHSMGAMRRKFRIWRCDIPRDNASLTSDSVLGIFRDKVRSMNRIRSPWVYLKLKKEKEYTGKTELHDTIVTYFD